MNNKIKIIVAIALILIVFYSGRFSNVNSGAVDADTFSWLYRINYYPWIVSSNLKGIDIGENRDLKYAGTIAYHPGVTIMTFSGITTKIGKVLKVNEDPQYEQCAYADYKCKYLPYELFIAKLPLIIISGILFGASMFLLSSVFTLPRIIPWVLVVLFEPLLIDSSKALHLDYLFAMFSVAAVSSLIFSINKNKTWMMFIAGVFMGFALLTRFAGVFMIPGILASLLYLDRPNFIKNLVMFGIGAVIIFVGFYPPMWAAPIETLTYIIRSSRGISDNLAGVIPAHTKYFMSFSWYANSYWKALSFPSICILIIGIIGLFYSKMQSRKFAYSIAIIYITYFAFVNLADKQYLRYLVPVIIGVMIPASIGFHNLSSAITKWIRNR